MDKFNYDDKDLVILTVLILGIVSMFALPGTESPDIISNIITGLFGVAVGKSIK